MSAFGLQVGAGARGDSKRRASVGTRQAGRRLRCAADGWHIGEARYWRAPTA